MPASVRLALGGAALCVCALLLLMAGGQFGEPAPESLIPFIIVISASAALGLSLVIGVIAGGDGWGRRPAAMPLAMRLLLDLFGIVLLLAAAAFFADLAAVSGASDGPAAAIMFALVAALFAAGLVWMLGRIIGRAIRGLPYDDTHGVDPDLTLRKRLP